MTRHESQTEVTAAYPGLSRRAVLRCTAFAAGAVALGSAVPRLAHAESALAGKRVAYVAFGLQFEFQVALVASVRKQAANLGIRLQVIDGKGDPNLQTTQVLDAISKQPDILLIDPVDPKLLIGAVKRANSANIPIFVLENAPPEGDWLGVVDFDNVAGGRMGADELARLVGGKGTVIQCRGGVGSPQAQARLKGFNEQMAAKYHDITVDSLNTEWTADKADTMVVDAFTRNPQIAGIWSHNDEMVRGIVSALRQIRRLKPVGEAGHIPIVGLDGTPLALKRIRDGIQDASVGQNPAAFGSVILADMVAWATKQPFQKSQLVEPILVTKQNAANPALWGNAAHG